MIIYLAGIEVGLMFCLFPRNKKMTSVYVKTVLMKHFLKPFSGFICYVFIVVRTMMSELAQMKSWNKALQKACIKVCVESCLAHNDRSNLKCIV